MHDGGPPAREGSGRPAEARGRWRYLAVKAAVTCS